MNWVAFALIAPMFWALSNFVDKYLLLKHTKGVFDFLFFCTITSWLVIVVLLWIFGMPELNGYSWIPVGTGAALVYSYGFYAKALEKGDTSSLVILFELIPVITVVLGFLFLGQVLSPKEFFAFVVVLTGTFLVSFEKTAGKFMNGFALILVSIVIWSIHAIFTDFGLTKIPFWDFILLDSVGTVLACATLFILPKVRTEVLLGIRSAKLAKYGWFSVNNILDFFGQLVIKKAYAIAPSAGLVTAVMQVQSFYAIVVGTLLTLLIPYVFKENISTAVLFKKSLGALVMFIGVYLLVV